jgi:hypothetical protein
MYEKCDFLYLKYLAFLRPWRRFIAGTWQHLWSIFTFIVHLKTEKEIPLLLYRISLHILYLCCGALYNILLMLWVPISHDLYPAVEGEEAVGEADGPALEHFTVICTEAVLLLLLILFFFLLILVSLSFCLFLMASLGPSSTRLPTPPPAQEEN